MAATYTKTTRWDYHSTGTEVVEAFKDKVQGKTILITGPSTGGIGATTALALAAASPSVILLLGRSPSKVQTVLDELTSKYPHVQTHFITCDLSSQSSIRSSIPIIHNHLGGKALDFLICNAAIMGPPFSLTVDRIESQFGTNHIGHFLLVNLLLPDFIKSADGGRVVVVSSSAMAWSGIRWEDWNFDGDGEKGKGGAYDESDGYSQSKFANVLFAKSVARVLEKRGEGGKAFSLNPGSIKTNLQVYLNAADQSLLAAAIGKAKAAEARHGREWKREAPKSLDQGCATTLIAALDPSLNEKSGVYLNNGDVGEHQPPGTSVEDQDRLWELSEKLVGEKFTW